MMGRVYQTLRNRTICSIVLHFHQTRRHEIGSGQWQEDYISRGKYLIISENISDKTSCDFFPAGNDSTKTTNHSHGMDLN